MSTELSNGVIIPEEYSDDWYDEMSINLRKLNDVITAASDNATNIQRLDTDKANQSDLTALTSRVSQNETDIIALQTAVSGALKREIVQTLPTEDISTTTIYMIRNSESSGTNIYDEYMYINSQWELIGTSATDFSNYYTKNETDNLLSGKVDNSTLGSYYTKTESDNLLSAKANQTDLTSLSGRVTQNETDITALQTAVSGALKREIVQSLPTQDISTTTIYMIRNTTTSGDNIYDEYMYINNLWELIGTSATDFSNYYTKTEIDTLLSDKANNSDVVHKSGNETVGGIKTFSDNPVIGNNNTNITISNRQITANGSYSAPTGSSYSFMQLKAIVNYADSSPSIDATVDLSIQENAYSDGKRAGFNPNSNNTINLGLAGKRWANVYAINYYYGSDNVEFSTKFVTTDTAQTISGNKTFLDVPISLKSSTAELGVTGGSTQVIFTDKNLLNLAGITFGNYGSSKLSYCRFHIYDKDSNNQEIENFIEFSYVNNNQLAYFRPNKSNFVTLGTVNNKWYKVYANEYYYGSNNVEFSTKFVTTDTAQTIAGNKTFGNGTLIVDNTTGSNVHGEIKLNGSRSGYIVADNAFDGVFASSESGVSILLQDSNKPLHVGGYKVDANGRVFADNTNKNPVLSVTSSLVKTSVLVPENDTVNPMFRILSELNYANGNPSKTLDVRFIQYDNANATSAVYSNDDNKTSLGLSSRRWSDVLTYKVNGVEPSSLSLPSGNARNFIDISSYFANTGTGETNSYTASANGWIYLRLGDISSCQATVYDANNNQMWGQTTTGSVEQMTIPILKGQTLTTQWETGSSVNVATARFIPCLGNI